MSEKIGELINDFIVKMNEHPNKNNMTYKDHLLHAWNMGFKSAIASSCFFIHGLFPFLLEDTGTEYILMLHKIIRIKKLDNELFGHPSNVQTL